MLARSFAFLLLLRRTFVFGSPFTEEIYRRSLPTEDYVAEDYEMEDMESEMMMADLTDGRRLFGSSDAGSGAPAFNAWASMQKGGQHCCVGQKL